MMEAAAPELNKVDADALAQHPRLARQAQGRLACADAARDALSWSQARCRR